MSIKRPQLENNEFYHLILRGVGDSKIFRNDNDYCRVLFSLYEFNTAEPIEIRNRYGGLSSDTLFNKKRRKLLIEIHAFCLMPNHIHLLVKQKVNNGITQFMRKFGTGYASYFNIKYKRKGHLFQGRFRAVHIKSDAQLEAVFIYIHTNPVSLIDFRWKEKGTINAQKAVKFLENYKWSSFLDYIGNKNFPSITQRNFITAVLGGKRECQKAVSEWVKGKEINFKDVEFE